MNPNPIDVLRPRPNPTRKIPALCWIFALAACASALAGAPSRSDPPYATVDDEVISRDAYAAALAAAIRQKYYHARPPAHELQALRREVGDRLVERTLLLREAAARGIAADRTEVDRALAEYEQRYAANPAWREQREQLRAGLAGKLAEQSVLAQLESRVRTASPVSEAEARAYYDRQPRQFTEPEQVRISLILLRVEPSAPRGAWEAARGEAEALHARLAGGADFAELARAHSKDASAASGGDLGYLHRGMLPEAVHAGVIDGLKPGEVSAPVALLEGVALVRLDERRPERRVGFDAARRRAAQLAEREAADARWQKLIAELRGRARISIDDAHDPSAATE